MEVTTSVGGTMSTTGVGGTVQTGHVVAVRRTAGAGTGAAAPAGEEAGTTMTAPAPPGPASNPTSNFREMKPVEGEHIYRRKSFSPEEELTGPETISRQKMIRAQLGQDYLPSPSPIISPPFILFHIFALPKMRQMEEDGFFNIQG